MDVIFCSELSFQRKQKEKTADHKHKHQDKETEFTNQFKLKKLK